MINGVEHLSGQRKRQQRAKDAGWLNADDYELVERQQQIPRE
jgi:hypothetical protein